ncbi:NADP-dependent oxidoreductase [Nocardioides sp. CER19]|uniref:NADP-dependent oxidoreductase n=1 Tax=Nocardioides sp. CER19 TaxID=3038538 RepID=UPI0024479334|nr:NADP-dependent oxidoreductase [Nocardioides sp. CER19]MDH2416735.1 NADP-dependent oxidoreductase [Nocardioides sp. CER19]
MATIVVATDFGGPEVLDVIETEVPQPGPGEVRITVRAAGVNPADLKLREGLFGHPPLPLRLGSEVAGVVAEVGSDVEGLAVGDEVAAYRVSGGYASELVAKATNVFRKPASLSFEEASGLMLVGATAVHALEAARVGEGDTLLVHAASGGVGQQLLQLARRRGVRVIGTGSARSFDLIRELGAEPVAYGDGLADRVRAVAPDGVTAAVDLAGTDEALAVSLELVPDRERIVTASPRQAAVDAGITGIGGGPGADPGTEIRNAARSELLRLAGEGELTVRVSRTFPLAEVADAHRFVAEGHAAGKVVLIP